MSEAAPFDPRALAQHIARARGGDRPAPPGFAPMELFDPFEAHLGPYFVAENADHDAAMARTAFYVAAHHLNANSILHGGALMTFADAVLGSLAFRACGRAPCVTLSLQTSFLAPARAGDLVVCDSELVRRTREIIFIAGRFSVGDRQIASVTSLWKVLRPR